MSAPLSPPSSLFGQYLRELRETAKLGPVLDLACGRGRHAKAAAAAGLPSIALDRNHAFLLELHDWAANESRPLQPLRFDLEAGREIPLLPGRCGAVLVFRYLWRPIAPAIEACLAPGGLLLYETFTTRQLEFGTGPRDPAYLLEPGELPHLFPNLEVVSLDERVHADEATASLAARRCERS